jgi:hypothetical protein
MQVGHTDRLLAQLEGTEDRPLKIMALPPQGIEVPAGGTVHVAPDGLIVVDPSGEPYCFISVGGVVVGRQRAADRAAGGKGRPPSGK